MFARSKVTHGSAQRARVFFTAGSISAKAKTCPPTGTEETARHATRLSELAEGLCAHALEKDELCARSMLEELQAQVWEARPMMRPEVGSRLAKEVREARVAIGRGKLAGAALAAVEIYRLAERQIPAEARKVPLRVSLLNYAALKLMAHSHGSRLDWNEVYGAIGEAVISAARLERLVRHGLLGGLAMQVDKLLSDAARTREPWRVEDAALRLHVMALRIACGTAADVAPRAI